MKLPPGLTLRAACDADAVAIQGLIGAILRSYDQQLNLDEDVHLRAPHSWFAARGGAFWVVEAGTGLAATVAVKRVGEDAELKALYVAPAQRRRGLARALTELVLDFARDQGCRRLVLWSDTRFDAAHALYDALGFTRHGERDLHDSNRTREYGFFRPLEPK